MKRFAKLPQVCDLSEHGKDAFHTTLHPPSREVNPGYPDADNTASVRTNNNINYNIEAPSGLQDGSSKWSCASFLNPNVLYTPGLVVAWIEGHRETLTEPLKLYMTASGDEFAGSLSTSFGSETYIYLGGSSNTDYYFSHKDPGNAIAYIKPVRDSYSPKSEAFSEWRTIGASSDIQMEVADLYRQGIIFAGQMPAPTNNSININNGTSGPATPVPPVVDQITYTYVDPNSSPVSRDKLVPISTVTINNNDDENNDQWYTDSIEDIKQAESYDFTQLPKGSYFIDTKTVPTIAEIVDVNELQVKTRCFDVKDGVRFTASSTSEAINNLPFTLYPKTAVKSYEKDLAYSYNQIPAGVYNIEFQTNEINIVSPKFMSSGDFPSSVSSAFTQWYSVDAANQQSTSGNHLALRQGVKLPLSAPTIDLVFSVPGVTVHKVTSDHFDTVANVGDAILPTTKYDVNGNRIGYPSNFTYKDKVVIKYMLVPKTFLPYRASDINNNDGLIDTFDLLMVDEGYSYFATSENLDNVDRLTTTPSNMLFDFKPPVYITDVYAGSLYELITSKCSLKEYIDSSNVQFGDFNTQIADLNKAFKFLFSPDSFINVNADAKTGYSTAQWQSMISFEFRSQDTIPELPTDQQWTCMKNFIENAKTSGVNAVEFDFMTRGRLILTTPSKAFAGYIGDQIRTRVLTYPGAILLDPVNVYYKTYSTVPLTQDILGGTVTILESPEALVGFWKKLKKILLGIAKVLNIITTVVEYVTAIVSLVAVERTVGRYPLGDKFEDGSLPGSYVSISTISSTNCNLPLDRDSIQTMSQMDSSLAKEGSFQVARLYDRSNPYAPGGAIAYNSAHTTSVDGVMNSAPLNNYSADLFTIWTDAGSLCNRDFRDVLVSPNDNSYEVTAKTSYIAKADTANATSNNGFYNNAQSQCCWGCPVVLYTGLLKQAALRCRISRDLEIIPVINQSLAPLATNPAQPDFHSIDVTLKYLNVLPILMPYKCVKPVEFMKILQNVSTKIPSLKANTDTRSDSMLDSKISKLNNRITEIDSRLKKLATSLLNVNNRMSSMSTNKPYNNTRVGNSSRKPQNNNSLNISEWEPLQQRLPRKPRTVPQKGNTRAE